MIYISAQPDTLYFLWQIEVQLYNFNRLNIRKEDIHVLIAYDPTTGLREEFKTLMDTNDKACFFAYPDDRVKKTYLSSIRPNILKKHFKSYKYLTQETLFYHDSDIILREALAVDILTQTETWYVSDTRNYIAPSYIRKFGDEILHTMCDIVDVAPNLVLENENNSGGAQYVLKNVDETFWQKVETDCEKIFISLSEFNVDLLEKDKTARTIQAWCADMWALLWNALRSGHKVEIHPELDFCWPMQELSYWNKCKIFHNAGVKKNDPQALFCKGLYTNYPPYHNNHTTVPADKCSVKYVEEITAYAESLERYDLSDVTFIIPIRMDSEDRLNNLDLILRFLKKHFNTTLLVIEKDDIARVNLQALIAGVNYTFIPSKTRDFFRTQVLNRAVVKCITPIVSIYDSDVIADPEHIIEAVNAIRNGIATLAYPYNGSFININRGLIGDFYKHLNFKSYHYLLDSGAKNIRHSYGGCFFVNRKEYIECGMENEFFSSWGKEDVERAKRIQILGYKIHRTKGSLIHFNHYRGDHSKPQDMISSHSFDKEYLKICNMNKADLQHYVNSWNWTKILEKE